MQQDKEMDGLFRSKLEGFEAEPSAAVWAGISAGLQGKPARKSYGPFLRIAASVVLLISAGLLFLPGKETKTSRAKPNKLAQNNVVKPGFVAAKQNTVGNQLVKKNSQQQIIKKTARAANSSAAPAKS